MSLSLAEAVARLAASGIELPEREARWLSADPACFAARIARRAAREPLAYILGDAPFRSLTLAVSPATLIPRADSETLIEAALAARPQRDAVRQVLDLGTGTGCLLLAALVEYPDAHGIGVDLAEQACRLARANAAANGLAGRCDLVCGDWAEAITGRFDLVLANPPYIRSADLPHLMPEVARYEPWRALDGGPDGLHCTRRLLEALGPLLAPQGIAIFELGADQAEPAVSLAHRSGWAAAIRRDSSGHARAMILCREAKKSFGAAFRPG